MVAKRSWLPALPASGRFAGVRLPGGGRLGPDARGSAVVEFLLVTVLLMFVTLAVMQVAVYLYIRNVTVASATEGARYAANSDSSPTEGAARANELLAKGVGSAVANRVSCGGELETGEAAKVLVVVRCSGKIPAFFAPVGGLIPLDVSAHAMREGP